MPTKVDVTYAQTITFLDGLPHRRRTRENLPVQVTSRVLIDGELVPGLVNASVEASRGEATVVTLDVHADHVGAPFIDSNGVIVPGCIDGHAFLTPARDKGEDTTWELVDEETGIVRCLVFVGRVWIK